MTDRPTVIITGSSGFVGSALMRRFHANGFHVRAFQRTIPDEPIPGVEYYPFDLLNIRDIGFQGADYIIHCAYRPVVSGRDRASSVSADVESVRRLLALARKYGVKFIYLSTLSAHPDAKSYYGRYKLSAEGLFDPQRDLIIKPGLVLGEGGGLFGRIASILKEHTIIPLVDGGRQRIQTIALDDLCRIIELGVQKGITGTYLIAHPAPVLMKDLYRKMALRAGKRPRFVPVPLFAAYYLLLVAERLGLNIPVTSQNALGLRDLIIFDTEPSLRAFGVQVKDYRTTIRALNL